MWGSRFSRLFVLVGLMQKWMLYNTEQHIPMMLNRLKLIVDIRSVIYAAITLADILYTLHFYPQGTIEVGVVWRGGAYRVVGEMVWTVAVMRLNVIDDGAGGVGVRTVDITLWKLIGDGGWRGHHASRENSRLPTCPRIWPMKWPNI